MSRITLLLMVTSSFVLSGCGSSEPTVIEPKTYQMSEQEQANRERAERALAEQRQ